MSKKGAVSQSLHKVIMVGSGGVGKSALTLQVEGNNKIIENIKRKHFFIRACFVSVHVRRVCGRL